MQPHTKLEVNTSVIFQVITLTTSRHTVWVDREFFYFPPFCWWGTTRNKTFQEMSRYACLPKCWATRWTEVTFNICDCCHNRNTHNPIQHPNGKHVLCNCYNQYCFIFQFMTTSKVQFGNSMLLLFVTEIQNGTNVIVGQIKGFWPINMKCNKGYFIPCCF